MGTSESSADEPRWEWKITTEWIPSQDSYYMRVWERELTSDGPTAWKCLAVGGARAKDQLGHHRRLFAKIIRSVVR